MAFSVRRGDGDHSNLIRKRTLFPGGKSVGGWLSVQSEVAEPERWGPGEGVRSSPRDAGVQSRGGFPMPWLLISFTRRSRLGRFRISATGRLALAEGTRPGSVVEEVRVQGEEVREVAHWARVPRKTHPPYGS
jgi:hypothetical protein